MMLSMPFRVTVGWLDAATRNPFNPVGCILGGCCDCCVNCYKSHLYPMSRNGYLDVSLQATTFGEASEHVIAILDHEAKAVSVLHGATWLFQIVGLGTMAVIGNVVTNCQIKWQEKRSILGQLQVGLRFLNPSCSVAPCSLPFCLVGSPENVTNKASQSPASFSGVAPRRDERQLRATAGAVGCDRGSRGAGRGLSVHDAHRRGLGFHPLLPHRAEDEARRSKHLGDSKIIREILTLGYGKKPVPLVVAC